jgi:hypothetical protein
VHCCFFIPNKQLVSLSIASSFSFSRLFFLSSVFALFCQESHAI